MTETITDIVLNDLQRIAAQCCTKYFRKQPDFTDLRAKNRTDNVPILLVRSLNAFQRAAIIILILLVVFLISVPAVIVGCIGRVKNITCTTDPANWLIVFGCIGIIEAGILITFVSLAATCCYRGDQRILLYVLRIAISIMIIGPCIQLIYGIFTYLQTRKIVPKCSDGVYYYSVVLFSILCITTFIFTCYCVSVYCRRCWQREFGDTTRNEPVKDQPPLATLGTAANADVNSP